MTIILRSAITLFAAMCATIPADDAIEGDNTAPIKSLNPLATPSDQGATLELNRDMIFAYLPDNTHKLLAGDVIRFFVREDEEPPQILPVKENGTVNFPYIGYVKVQGFTPKQVADVLKYELERTYYYQATVHIAVERTTNIRGRIYVSGEVRKQGEVLIPANRDFRLSNAIFAAGTTKYSKLKEIKVIHTNPDGTESTRIIDGRPIFEDGSSENDIILQDGDRVIIDKKGIVW